MSEPLRPIFNGHTGHCIYCGEIGGICEDEYCTGDEGLNSHTEGEYGHKWVLCRCERINLENEQVRSHDR